MTRWQSLGTVWRQPAATFTWLLAQPHSEAWFIVLSAAYGIERQLYEAWRNPVDPSQSATTTLLLMVLTGAALGVAMHGVTAGALAWSGRRLGGVGEAHQVRTVLAFAAVPKICALLLWPMLWLSQGTDLGTLLSEEGLQVGRAGAGVYAFVRAGLGAWTVYLGLVAVAVVHRVDRRRGCLTWLLALPAVAAVVLGAALVGALFH